MKWDGGFLQRLEGGTGRARLLMKQMKLKLQELSLVWVSLSDRSCWARRV